MMFGWLFVSIVLFFRFPAEKAVVISVIGGVLFLPMARYDLPGIPAYTRSTAIALGILLGGILSGKGKDFLLTRKLDDLPMIGWCFVFPVLTSLSNRLGLYGGISDAIGNTLSWGVFYWAGRKYFRSESALRMLVHGIIIGGIVYIPITLFELWRGPVLHESLYGWLQHKLIQHIRYGGYRPIAFMQHGLMVSLWMAITALFGIWVWRTDQIERVGKIPISVAAVMLTVLTILCKSANGWIFLLMGLGALFLYQRNKSVWIFRALLLAIPLYFILRITNLVSVTRISRLFSIVFDQQRIGSLMFRLWQENLFSARALENPLFGWGGYRRGYPVDPWTGEELFRVIDSMWVGLLSRYGLFGLAGVFLGLGIGPWRIFSFHAKQTASLNGVSDRKRVYQILLSIAVVFFMVDSLMNSMMNHIYILCAGVLVSQADENRIGEASVQTTDTALRAKPDQALGDSH